MQYILTKLKIKDGKKEKAEAFLNHLKKEAYQDGMESVIEARILLECSYIDSHTDGHFIYIFKKLEDLQLLKNKIATSKLEIYDQIRAWANECFENRTDLEPIVVFEPNLKQGGER